MPRIIKEIANDLREAVTVMSGMNAEMARAAGGEVPAGARPQIEVRLADGRTVELLTLTNELVAAVDHV